MEVGPRDASDVSCDRDWLQVLSCVPSASARLCGKERGTSCTLFLSSYFSKGGYLDLTPCFARPPICYIDQFMFQEGAVSIRLRFVSDDSGRRRGFRIRYEMLQVLKTPSCTRGSMFLPFHFFFCIFCLDLFGTVSDSKTHPDSGDAAGLPL